MSAAVVRHQAPSREKIVAANADLISQLGNLWDPDEALHSCWACGALEGHGLGKARKIIRAHVVAHRHCGDCSPVNFFLLCDKCHAEQPDGVDRASQEHWLLHHESRATLDLRMIVGVVQRVSALASEAEITNEELVAFMNSRTFKIKVGHDPAFDTRNIQAMMNAFEACIMSMLPSLERVRSYKDARTGIGPVFRPELRVVNDPPEPGAA